MRYLLGDGLGSVRQAVDEIGAVAAYHEYDTYGNPKPETVNPKPCGSPIVNRKSENVNRYGFTGEWWDVSLRLKTDELAIFLAENFCSGT